MSIYVYRIVADTGQRGRQAPSVRCYGIRRNMKIRSGLSVARKVFGKDNLLYPYECCILDGYNQQFEITANGRHITAKGSNIQACGNDMEYCCHSVLMRKVLEKIGRILIPLGVPKKCFRIVN